MKNDERLEKLTNELLTRYEHWEDETIGYIGARLKKLEKLTPADVQAINNAAEVERDLNHIFEQLAQVTDKSVEEVSKIYGDVFSELHDGNSGLYDYRNMPFTPLQDDKKLQGMINAFSKKTGEELINLTNTKAIGFVNANGSFGTVKTTIFDALGKAAIGVRSGTVSFHTATKRAVEELGASGVVIDYGNGVHRSVESVVRANVLYGAKQASEEYNKLVGEEIGCDGIEIDWHPHPRPAHEFIQGRQFINGKSRRIDGVFFQGADDIDPKSPDGLSANEALNQYGCLHSPMPIICGISEPTYDPEQLRKLNEENSKPIEIDGVTKTGYEWKQSMRRLEREARKEKRQIAGLEGLGDKNAIKEHRQTLSAIRKKHAKIAESIGSRVDEDRMSIYKGAKSSVSSAKGLKNGGDGGIIKRKLLNEKSKSANSTENVSTKMSTDRAIGSETWNADARQNLAKAESIIVGNDYETAIIYDEKGSVLFKKKGNRNSVEFTKNELKKMKGTVITHNHPSNATFSAHDINMLRVTGAHEIRAVTRNGTFVLTAPQNWQNGISNLQKIDNEFNIIWDNCVLKAKDRAAQEGKPLLSCLREAEIEATKVFGEKYGFGFRLEKV